MSRFPPVHLPEDRKLDGRVSQTFLRHASRCPRSAYLYALYKGEAQNDAMIRGSAAHAIFERSTKLAIDNGEQTIPPELVRDVLTEVLAEFPVPWDEQDFLRELTWRWSSEWTLDPSKVVACETLFVLEVGGWEVRVKPDFAELRDRTIYVADYKSGKGAFSLDDVARKRSDGTFLPRTFQLVINALAVRYGHPVSVEECVSCEGRGHTGGRQAQPLMDTVLQAKDPCPDCRGGRREIPQEPVAPRAQGVIAEFVYPAIENAEGHMLRRETSLTALELIEQLESLKALIDRVAASERTGDWPAIVSTPGCGECPAKQLCPIPPELRDHEGEVESVEQAAALLEALDVQSSEAAAIRRAIKSFCKEHDVEVRFGADKVARFVYSKTERLNKDAVLAAIRDGRELTADEALSVSESTNFKDVKLTADELEENSNGVE